MNIPSSVSVCSISGLYIHIPFCQKVCPFCSFAVLKDNQDKHDRYLDALKQELQLVSTTRKPDFSTLESVYVGGGTPSRLSMASLIQLTNWISSQCGQPEQAEWSIEVNPEDVTDELANGLADLGYSRVSIGIQSFNDRQLKRLGRQHNAEQARRSLTLLSSTGFFNLNLDLMFGYPGQTMASLDTDLTEALSFPLHHISAYSLTIEPKTILYRKSAWQEWMDRNESLVVKMYQRVIERLSAGGLNQYEVSNFCRPGFESRQNLVYWHNRSYLGLGTGAHSHCCSFRWGNHKRLVDYGRALHRGEQPCASWEAIDPFMRRDEDLMLGLRLAKGLDLEHFCQKHRTTFSSHWNETIERFQKSGLLTANASCLRLTTKGMLLANEISAVLAARLS